jgi:hypothetical protein
MSSKSRAMQRLGGADVFNIDDLDDCGFLFLYFFLGGRYGAGEDFQLPLCCFEPVVYARPVCVVMFVEVIGMFRAESSVGNVQDVEAEAPQSEGPPMGGVEKEVGSLRVFIDKHEVAGAKVIDECEVAGAKVIDECEVAGAKVVDSGSSVFFVVVVIAALAPCIVIGSSRTCCARSRTASRRATSAFMDDGGFEVGEG